MQDNARLTLPKQRQMVLVEDQDHQTLPHLGDQLPRNNKCKYAMKMLIPVKTIIVVMVDIILNSLTFPLLSSVLGVLGMCVGSWISVLLDFICNSSNRHKT